jgi:SpoVK/Ycf46/Vps4 family AAA+-type ATPase
MTTNHREKLDPALLRPGRTDFEVRLDNASYNQMFKMFLRFNPGLESLADEFAKQLPEGKLSMAKLQGHLMKYRDQPENQVKHAPELLADTTALVEDMTITEYLRRLNLSDYAAAFPKNKVFLLSDLRFYGSAGQATSVFGIQAPMLAKRLADMINDGE